MPSSAPATGPELLAGRYRLTEPLRSGDEPGAAGAQTWRGEDEPLRRPVLVRLVPGGDRRAGLLLEAAAEASRVSHPLLASVYDADEQDGFVYVAREWAEGLPLDAALADGPWEPLRAQQVLTALTEALREVEARGLPHGRLHPGNVIAAPDGRVTVTDLRLAAAIADGRLPVPPGAGGRSPDVAALGALGYAALTARWPGRTPGEGWGELPAAPWSGGRPRSPRQVRPGGVPPGLSSTVRRAVGGAAPGRDASFDTVAELARELATLPDLTPVPRRPPSRRRRLAVRAAVWVVALAGLAGVTAGAYALGTSVGALPGAHGGRYAALTRPGKAPTRGAAPLMPVTIDGGWVSSYNPEGDGPENPTAAQLAVDGDPTTAWTTYTYRGRPDFGGLKAGTGLLVDLQQPVAVRQAAVSFLQPGADVELLAADRPAADVNGFRLIARAHVGKAVVLLTPATAPAAARYWLVWLTRLPPVAGGYRAAVGEIQLRR